MTYAGPIHGPSKMPAKRQATTRHNPTAVHRSPRLPHGLARPPLVVMLQWAQANGCPWDQEALSQKWTLSLKTCVCIRAHTLRRKIQKSNENAPDTVRVLIVFVHGWCPWGSFCTRLYFCSETCPRCLPRSNPTTPAHSSRPRGATSGGALAACRPARSDSMRCMKR